MHDTGWQRLLCLDGFLEDGRAERGGKRAEIRSPWQFITHRV
jgi:hypothetical protein